MKISLDLQLNTNLREKINEYSVFTDQLRDEFRFPSQKRGENKKETGAYNCLCAALDRINETATHCNTLDIGNENIDGLFAFYDFLNYSQTLIDCITILGRIFGVKYNLKDGLSCFRYTEENEKGNDEKYFKYLRSLCAIHPVQTNSHPEYQGDEPEWCPYIASGKSAVFAMMYPEWDKPDFVAVVYRNDVQFSKYIPIYTEELFAYVKKRYAFLNDIVIAAEAYYQKCIDDLKQKHIPTPDECEDYLAYLKELEAAMQERCGKFYHVREWSAIMQTYYDDEAMQELLIQYQPALKTAIQEVHNQLQTMACIDCDLTDLGSLTRYIGNDLDGYGYEMEKIHYLYPSGCTEDADYDVLGFVNAEINFDQNRMTCLLSIINNAIQQKATHDELRDLARAIYNEFHVSDSEWARIQLKITEFAYSKHFKFDYMQNDWHLYLQVQIANWLQTTPPKLQGGNFKEKL